MLILFVGSGSDALAPNSVILIVAYRVLLRENSVKKKIKINK